MDIDVVVFTPSAPVWHIQGYALHLYIMGDSKVPWFGPIPPIGCQGTQKATGGMTKKHNDGDGRHDDGDRRHVDAAQRRDATTARGSRATGSRTHNTTKTL